MPSFTNVEILSNATISNALAETRRHTDLQIYRDVPSYNQRQQHEFPYRHISLQSLIQFLTLKHPIEGLLEVAQTRRMFFYGAGIFYASRYKSMIFYILEDVFMFKCADGQLIPDA